MTDGERHAQCIWSSNFKVLDGFPSKFGLLPFTLIFKTYAPGALDKMLLQSYQGTPILLFPFQSRIDMSEIVPLKTVEESFFGWVGLV